MITHEMRLNPAPFERIKAGKKTVEMRLYDEKRRKLRPCEQLRFTNVDTGETMLAKIVALHPYQSFHALYERFDKIALGYTENEAASPADMEAYYSAEDIEKYGVVGIELRLIDK